MTFNIPNEIYQDIFKYIDENDLKTFYSSMTVNKIWCLNIIPYLWKNPFKLLSNSYKILTLLFSYLDNERRDYLLIRDEKFENLLFDYPSFIKQLDLANLYAIIEQWIYENKDNRPKLKENYFINNELSYNFNFRIYLEKGYIPDIKEQEIYAFFDAIFDILMNKCEKIEKISMDDANLEHSNRICETFFKTILSNNKAKRWLINCERLKFGNNWFKKELILFLINISLNLKSIHIDLSQIFITNSKLQILTKLIKLQRNLQEFHINLGSELDLLLNSLSNLTNTLKYISISYGHINLNTNILFLSKCSQLEELTLNKLDLTNCIYLLSRIKLPKLKRFHIIESSIDGYNYDRDTMFLFIRNNGNNLTDLSLFICLYRYSSDCLQTIIDYCPKLVRLAIRISKKEEISLLFNIMKYCKSLKYLYIPYDDYNESIVLITSYLNEFAKNIPPTLISLDLTKWVFSLDILNNFLENFENPVSKFKFNCNSFDKEDIQNVIKNFAIRKFLIIKRCSIEIVYMKFFHKSYYKCIIEWI
ncbi:hypothetical protein C1645_823970 [Glomus cerebriforme]|uniref:F-box domain-containing protein n=1 Tax=Glomus cerebriforme TaxID=658196 RepID=A0A397SV05_9GLOM|nr:hypothetical protein C1645_823970 [Glomus cerebriforme]